MNIQIITNDLEIDSKQRDIITQKLVKPLEKYLQDFDDDITQATLNIEFIDPTNSFESKFNMWLPGKNHMFGQGSGTSLTKSIVDLRNQLERQIKQYKSKLNPNKK